MKLRKILSVTMAATVAISSFMLPMTAEATYASPTEMIKDILYTACTGIDIDSAWNTLESHITVEGNDIKLNDVSIGYWDSDTIYSDSSLSTVYAEQIAGDVECNKTFLSAILTGLNQNIVETYSPSTTDWSKIVGKYDITMGDVTIPADQWYTVSTTPDEFPTSSVANATNISSEYGISGTDLTSLYYSQGYVGVSAWMVDKNGKMFIQKGMVYAGTGVETRYNWAYTTLSGTYQLCGELPNGRGSLLTGDAPLLKVSVCEGTAPGSTYANHANMYVALSLTDATNSVVSTTTVPTSATSDEGMYNIDDPSEVNKADVRTSNIVAYGFVLMTGDQLGVTASEALGAKHKNMLLTPPTASKTVVGNSAITKRLGKLRALNVGDTVTITPTAWMVNGTENIDDYIALTEITTAGTPTSMQGSVDVEPLNFKVIVPSYLPMSVDPSGNVTTATNASIENRSNAPVQITSLDIAASALGGWTLVDSNPSKTRGANEFTFNTSLAVGNTIEQGDALNFTYSAEMSPVEEGIDNIDIVTLTVTLDWEE